MKIGGGDWHTCNMELGRGWADMRVSMVGGGGQRGPCPPRNGKKDAVRGYFNLSLIFY